MTRDTLASCMTAIGVDGAPAGWVAAAGYEDGRTALLLFEDFDELVRWHRRQASGSVVAVDVPIGLPARSGLRECDRQARARLGRRRSCVFPTPDRELLGLSFEGAREVVLERRAAAPGEHHPILSRQGCAIAPKIAEVDAVRGAGWLVEAHPEVSFLALTAGEALPSKKTAAGRSARRAALRHAFPDLDDRLDRLPWRRSEVGLDDVLDSYACLWTAKRVAAKSHEALGGRLAV
jgi:predicted RNase H-like nuclease